MGDKPNGRASALKETLASAFVEARDRVRHVDHEHTQHRVETFLDRLEDEIAPHVADMLDGVLDSPDIGDGTRTLLSKLAAPEHATAITLLFAAAGAVVYPLISAAITPEAQAVQQAQMRQHPNTPLSPAEVALGTIRNTLGGIDKYSEALRSGIDAARLDVLALNTGEPLSVGQLLEAYRRGEISLDRLRTGVRQSRVRDEWFDTLVALRYSPPPVGEVLAGAVQNHLPLDQARTYISEAGLDPVNFDWLYETHGRPPGIAEFGELVNRKFATEDEWRQAIRESDIKNKYIDAVLKTRFYLPPVRSIVPMLRAKAITEARARELLDQNGVRPEDVDAYVNEAKTTAKQVTRDLSAQQQLRLYGARLITEAETRTRLATFGYDADEIQDLIDLADRDHHERMLNAAVSRVHSRYVNHKIDRVDAQTALDSLDVPVAARDEWLTLWGHERAANVATLTTSQVQGALRRGMIDLDTFVTKCRQLGWQDDDLPVLAVEAFPPTKVPGVIFEYFGVAPQPLPSPTQPTV